MGTLPYEALGASTRQRSPATVLGIPFASLPGVRELARSIAAAVGTLVVCPRLAWAHVGRAPEPHDLWSSWTLAPVVIVGLALACWCYARGVRALWRAAGPGRGVPP